MFLTKLWSAFATLAEINSRPEPDFGALREGFQDKVRELKSALAKCQSVVPGILTRKDNDPRPPTGLQEAYKTLIIAGDCRTRGSRPCPSSNLSPTEESSHT